MLGTTGRITGAMLPDVLSAGVTLVVVGPDPERSRKWYGNIKLVKGVVKIS